MGSDTVGQPYLLPLLVLDFSPLTVFPVQWFADSSATSLQDAVGVTARGLISWTDRCIHTTTLEGRRGFRQRREINGAMTPRPKQRRYLT